MLPLPLEHNLQPLVLNQLGGQLHWETTFHVHICQPTIVYEVLFPSVSDSVDDTNPVRSGSGFRIRISILDPDSIRSVDPDPYSESGSGSRRAKMTHKGKAGRIAPLGTTFHVHFAKPTIVYEVLFPRVSDSVVDKNPVESGLSELDRSRTGSNLSDKKNVQAGMGNFIS